MKTTGKLKKGIRMQLKSLNDIVQYLETVQRSSYELIFDSVPGQTDLPDYHDCHVHKFWELKFRSPKQAGEPHRITLIPPGVVHCSTSREFSVDIMHRFIHIIGFNQYFAWRIYVNEEEDPHGDNLIPEILHAVSHYSKSKQFDSMRHDLMKAVIGNLLLLIRQNITEPRIEKPKRNLVEIASDYMENCYYEMDLSVSDIARFAGVSPQYLNSAFMKATGRTTRQNLIAIRLNHARELLEDSRYLVKDVAMFTGWRSPFYFSNSYRKAFGIPPQKQLQDRQKNSR